MKAHEYFPHRGDRTYAVAHYDLTLSYNVDSNHLRGKAALSAEAASDLRELRLDLSGLRVTKVTVDGAAARFVAKPQHLRRTAQAADRGGCDASGSWWPTTGSRDPCPTATTCAAGRSSPTVCSSRVRPTGRRPGSRATTGRTTRRPTGSS